MDVAKQNNFRFRLDDAVKKKWIELCDGKRISQQDAIESLVGWVLQQEDLYQSVLLGQIKTPDGSAVARILLERMAAAEPQVTVHHKGTIKHPVENRADRRS